MTASFGERLRVARHERGLSQRTLAKRARTTQARISIYETDSVAPVLDVRLRLAEALDAPDLLDDGFLRDALRRDIETRRARERKRAEAQEIARARRVLARAERQGRAS